VATQTHPSFGELVLFVAGAHGDPDYLAPGDILLDQDGSSFQKALTASKGTLSVRVRREGMGRTELVQLGTIPDTWYRVGSAKFERREAPPPTTTAAAPAPAPAAPPVAPPPDVPAAPVTPSGCTKDIECKGDRICVKGECVDAPAK
jgi:hypothetical protein